MNLGKLYIFVYFTHLKSEKFGYFGIVTPILTIPVRENSEVHT